MLRVSPLDNGDNPFLCVEPGTSFGYLIRVPPDHPAVTFWYDSHLHGMVANRIASFSHHRGGARLKATITDRRSPQRPPPKHRRPDRISPDPYATRRARRPVARA